MNNSNSQVINNLEQLFENWSGNSPDKFGKLPNSGSSRIYYRFTNEKTSALGVFNQNKYENTAFLKFTKHFLKYKIHVPNIYSINLSKNIYLIEDLGNTQLLNLVNETRINELIPEKIISFYKESLIELIKMQVIAGRDLDYSFCYPFKEFNKEAILFDLNYFLRNYIETQNFRYNHKNLLNDFEQFADYLLKADRDFFMFRDFQSRNIMIKNNQPYFIDYQGGRKGALQYDLASILYQAKANIPEPVRLDLVNFYLAEAEKYIKIDTKNFIEFFYGFALIRILQTLGAYGLRGLVEGKTHFIESIRPAIINLGEVSKKAIVLNQTKELKSLLKQLTENIINNDK